MTLEASKINEDLEKASSNDVAFDKELYLKLTGDYSKISDEKTEVAKCYEEVKEFLEKEEQLQSETEELKEKLQVSNDMKKELQEAISALEKEKEALVTLKTPS